MRTTTFLPLTFVLATLVATCLSQVGTIQGSYFFPLFGSFPDAIGDNLLTLHLITPSLPDEYSNRTDQVLPKGRIDAHAVVAVLHELQDLFAGQGRERGRCLYVELHSVRR